MSTVKYECIVQVALYTGKEISSSRARSARSPGRWASLGPSGQNVIRILIFDFVLLHIVCGCLTDILIFPLFQYCMMDWYLQRVSTHRYVDLEIECCKFVDCICVVSVICF